MWHDPPFSQRNKTTERAVGWGLEAIGKGGGREGSWTKFEKGGFGNIRGFIK